MNQPNTIRALLDRRLPPEAPAPAPNTAPEQEEYEAYAHGRIANRPQLMLVLRQADGAIRAFPYAYLSLIESDDPANGFTLHFPPHRIRITGRNLTRLFQLICQHRAAEITEVGQTSSFTADDCNAVVRVILVNRAT